VQRVDEMLARCLEPVAHCAAMLNVDKVRVVAEAGREKELSGLLPAGRFEVSGTAR